MNQIAINAEVHFHEQELVSIFHEVNVSGRDEQFAELIFSAAFAIRSISNLGNHPFADGLAQQLQLTGQLIAEGPDQILAPKPQLVAYQGHAGRKRFISKLRFSSSAIKFDYAAKGFGWFGTGIGYYCPAATQSMFRYFAHRRLDDDAYLATLADVAVGCGEMQLTRQIYGTNHPQLLMFLACTEMDDYTPEWLD